VHPCSVLLSLRLPRGTPDHRAKQQRRVSVLYYWPWMSDLVPPLVPQDLYDAIARGEYPEWRLFIQTMDPAVRPFKAACQPIRLPAPPACLLGARLLLAVPRHLRFRLPRGSPCLHCSLPCAVAKAHVACTASESHFNPTHPPPPSHPTPPPHPP
jgi:hypothetical protein